MSQQNVSSMPTQPSSHTASHIILVTGATGRQGGAVARHLLNAGYTVRALTRYPESVSAQQLSQLGAHIVAGDLEDPNSLIPAVKGAYGVFSVQNYWGENVGFSGEIRQGKNLVNAAKQMGVQHFIQSSMATGRDFEEIEHFESKAEIESYIRAVNLPHTIIGAVYFLDNLLDPKMGGGMTFPTLAGTLQSDIAFHVLAVDDLGGIVAAIFSQRERFLNRKLDIASDRLTVTEMKQRYQQTTGKQPKSWKLPTLFLNFANREFAKQLKWQNKVGWSFDLSEVREIYPNLNSFERFIQQYQITYL